MENLLKLSVQNQKPGTKIGTRIGKTLLYVLSTILSLPWYLLPRRGRPVRVKAIHELHPMSYLDALRGYLAMIILTGHIMPKEGKWIPKIILATPWLEFPFRGGHTAVGIFFWISGYAVTYKLVGLVQTRQTAKLHDALVSTIFRRYFRLFLPIIPLILVTAVGTKLGIVLPGQQKLDVIGDNPFLFWIRDTGHFLNPFCNVSPWYSGMGEGSHLLFHTWSINTEFRSSMIMLLVCMGTSKISTAKRKMFLWIVVPAFTVWQAHYASMAFLGMWFAECRQERRQRQEMARKDPSVNFHEKQRNLRQKSASSKFIQFVKTFNSEEPGTYGKLVLMALFLYSFVVLKNPYETDKMTLFPHNYINRVAPSYWHERMKQYVHLGIGAIMMLYPLDRLTFLQRPLLMPFSQFLGELSFGIYAVHIPVKWIVWEPRYDTWVKARYGNDALHQFWPAFSGWCIMAIAVLWSAEIFRRLDMQVIRFCKYLETTMFEQ